MPVILIFGIPLIKLLAGIGAVCLGIAGTAAGIDQINDAVKEGKRNRESKKTIIKEN